MISLADRIVHIAGITTQPDEAWMLQFARNLLDEQSGALAGKRFLIIDRDAKYTARFRELVEKGATEVIRLPPFSPDLNAYASYCTSSERIVVSSGKRRRSESFAPWDLTGGLSPGCSYKQACLLL